MDPVFLEALGQLGFPIALCIYLLKRDADRDKRSEKSQKVLEERLNRVETDQREELINLTNLSIKAINSQKERTERLTQSLESLITVVQPMIQQAAYSHGSGGYPTQTKPAPQQTHPPYRRQNSEEIIPPRLDPDSSDELIPIANPLLNEGS